MRKTVESACPLCGAVFSCRRKAPVYCSNACSGAARKNRIERECGQCSRKFSAELAATKRDAGKFCSFECSRMHLRVSSERFLSNYIPEPNSGCWLWTGCIYEGRGYGKCRWDTKNMSAHRASWIIHNGPIPDGMFVLHKCDTKICINPNHLYLGTQSQNMFDRYSRGNNHPGFRTCRIDHASFRSSLHHVYHQADDAQAPS